MPRPAYYAELYVALCRSDDSSVTGSGLCYDGSRIITCAHVVNSALNRDATDLEDKTGQQVQLRFTLSTLLDTDKLYRAKVVRWFPAAADKKLVPKNDLAVLELEDAAVQDLLQSPANELRFIADDISNNQFSCVSHNTMDPDEDPFMIKGTIGDYLSVTGRTQIHTSGNVKDAFFRAGSSGTPIFSETLNGISGIIDQLIVDHTDAVHAYMIDARRIAALLDDIVVHTPSLQKKNRDEKKFLCDRRQVVEAIADERADASRGNFFFLWGNHKQEGYDFRNRYRQQFLQSADGDGSTIFITVDLPMEVPALFKSRFYEAVAQSARNNNKRIELKPGDDIFTCHELLQRFRNKGFLFRIPDYSAESAACVEWFVNDFLKRGKAVYPPDLHILIIYEYLDSESAAAAANRDALVKLFGTRSALALENVSPKDIRTWISLFEESDSSLFKMKLLELLDTGSDYPMRAIFRKYEEAKNNIPDHEKF